MHVMLDLETLGTSTDALIMSIGAVKFDAAGVHDRFHVGVDIEETMAYGTASKPEISAGTVLWWLDNDRWEARDAWLALDDKVHLSVALDGFSQWYGTDDQPVWGNGATFDNVVVKSAYSACGLRPPWSYKLDRCYRTMVAMYPDVGRLERVGIHHNAVDDAEYQALQLIKVCAEKGIVL